MATTSRKLVLVAAVAFAVGTLLGYGVRGVLKTDRGAAARATEVKPHTFVLMDDHGKLLAKAEVIAQGKLVLTLPNSETRLGTVTTFVPGSDAPPPPAVLQPGVPSPPAVLQPQPPPGPPSVLQPQPAPPATFTPSTTPPPPLVLKK